MSDMLFLLLQCIFNLLRLFETFGHRSKTDTILGHSSGANLGTDSAYFGNLRQPNGHALYSQFLTSSDSETDLLPNLTRLQQFTYYSEPNYHVRKLDTAE